ncbi:unnamed protein product [Haemonchus placei]|uniref:Uncharacterized protein n=1 Tax=Haemonchus placei TaxID=6290 RepID=A0A0N4WCE8_HAEPC|nr:unnamed protein product [Haemonchus placei]
MGTQFNQRHGVLRRKFEPKATNRAKDYGGTKQFWTPGAIVRRVGNTTFVRCANLPWTRHVNQLRPRSDRTTTTTINTPSDVFDLPLFDYVSKDRAPQTTSTDHYDDRNAMDDRNADSSWTLRGPNTMHLKRGGAVGYY